MNIYTISVSVIYTAANLSIINIWSTDEYIMLNAP